MRFLWNLPGVLGRRVTPPEAVAMLRRRLADRESSFLALAHRAIYGNPASPYRQMLQIAGCEMGDLDRLVRLDGLENALRTLFERGVYLTVDELKGRKPAVRGSTTIPVNPSLLRDPASGTHFLTQTGGSRGAPTGLRIDLRSMHDKALLQSAVLAGRHGLGWTHALWGVPGGWSIDHLSQYAIMGVPPKRWFTQVDLNTPGLHSRYRWSLRLMRLAGLAAGVRLPGPEFVPISDPLPVARWMAETVRRGQTPHLITFPSPAVRLCQAAYDAGIDLRGAMITLQSEAVTPARVAVINRAGAKVFSSYGSAECGPIATACLNPETSDEVHFYSDVFGLVQVRDEEARPGLPADAMLFTSLRPSPRLLLLNVSMGDRADISNRSCGCAIGELGWSTHLLTIRSFEKLNAEGMTFLDADVVRVLEEVMPAKFGGGPNAYQLVEDESVDGLPHIRLVVDPAVGELDEEAVKRSFLDAVGGGTAADRVYATLWEQGKILHVERRVPYLTGRGKVLHSHRAREAQPAATTPADSAST
jgi:hypothetical protein